MDVEAIIHHLDEDLAAAHGRLRALQGRLAEAQAEVDDLTQSREGFLRTIERYGDQVATTREPEAVEPAEVIDEEEPAAHPWLAMSHSDAVFAALKEIGRPATAAEIHARLARVGRSEDNEKVRNTVGYLYRRAHRVIRVSRGLWDVPRPSADPAPTEGHASQNGAPHPIGMEEEVSAGDLTLYR